MQHFEDWQRAVLPVLHVPYSIARTPPTASEFPHGFRIHEGILRHAKREEWCGWFSHCPSHHHPAYRLHESRHAPVFRLHKSTKWRFRRTSFHSKSRSPRSAISSLVRRIRSPRIRSKCWPTRASDTCAVPAQSSCSSHFPLAL